jgi:predicted RNase H-like HicB family nuclease
MKYTAEATRSGNWWAITVPEIKGVFSQARRLDQVEAMAREAIALMLNVRPDSFHVEVKPDVPGEVVQARLARRELRRAEEAADQATRAAAQTLLKQGYTVRDAGSLLGISPQRVSQLTSRQRTARKATARKASKPTRVGKRSVAA